MFEYHKIETLYERNMDTFKVIPSVLKNSVYGLINNWLWTEKVDGTNIRVMWTPGVLGALKDPNLIIRDEDHLREIAPSYESLSFGGKTDNAQIHADLVKWLYANITIEKLREVFPTSQAVIYGEGYGPGIQKGGLLASEKKFIVFDVFVVDPVNSRMGGWWLSDENMRVVALNLGLDAVPFVGSMNLEQATEMVQDGFQSQLNGGAAGAEGLVGRPTEALFDKKGHRLIVKLKTKDFARQAA